MSARQPIDAFNNPIPVLELSTTTLRTFTSATARTAALTASGEKVFTLYSDQDVYLDQGTSANTATTSSFLLKAGVYLDIKVGTTNCYIAALRVSADGTLRLTERV